MEMKFMFFQMNNQLFQHHLLEILLFLIKVVVQNS